MDPYLLKELERLQIEMIPPGDHYLATLQITSSLVDKIKERQQGDPELMTIIKKVEEGSVQDFIIKDGVLRFGNRLCVPNDAGSQKELLMESHDSTLTAHPRSTKRRRDLKPYYWWSGMKRDIANYVA